MLEDLRKELPDGTMVDKVNHLEQSAKHNLTDMIIGFFSGNLLNKDNVRKIIMDVIEFANAHPDSFSNEDEEENEGVQPEYDEADVIASVPLSSCFIYLRIAETIVRELGDLELARKIYLQSEELAISIDDYLCLSDSIHKYLQDEVWSNKLKDKAHLLVMNSQDVITCNSTFYENN